MSEAPHPITDSGTDPARMGLAQIDAFLSACGREIADAWAMRRTLPEACRVQLDNALVSAQEGCATADDPAPWVHRISRLVERRRELDAHDVAVRTLVSQAFRDAGTTLRQATTLAELAKQAAREGCIAGGFSRVLISAVRGSRWVPLVVHSDTSIDPDPETLQAFIDAGNEIPLGNLLAETDLVRRKVPFLVKGGSLARRTFRPIVAAAQTAGYIGAPIVLGTEVVGIMHADRSGQRHSVNDDDRLLFAQFATLFGWLLDRLSSEDRLSLRIRRLDADLDRAKSALHRTGAPSFDRVPSAAAPGAVERGDLADGERDEVLTRREREILDLVAIGATNPVIAQRLTVSEETVKSHIRTILRKLHVTSRGAAVARLGRLRADA